MAWNLPDFVNKEVIVYELWRNKQEDSASTSACTTWLKPSCFVDSRFVTTWASTGWKNIWIDGRWQISVHEPWSTTHQTSTSVFPVWNVEIWVSESSNLRYEFLVSSSHQPAGSGLPSPLKVCLHIHTLYQMLCLYVIYTLYCDKLTKHTTLLWVTRKYSPQELSDYIISEDRTCV